MESSAKKSGLGRGLKALLSSQLDKSETTLELIKGDVASRLIDIPLKDVEEDPEQPRKNFNEEALEQLKNSIREVGILQPLIVRKFNNKYRLIAGERRLRAARALCLETVPILPIEVDELKKIQISLIENIQRESLNPIEEAMAFKRLFSDFMLTQDEISAQVGKSRAYVANTIRLLSLPDSVQHLLSDSKITRGHAKAILSLKDDVAQQKIAQKIIIEGLSVREVESIIEHMKILESRGTKPAKYRNTASETQPVEDLTPLAEPLIRFLGAKVKIRSKKEGGVLEIPYTDRLDLERLIEQIVDV